MKLSYGDKRKLLAAALKIENYKMPDDGFCDDSVAYMDNENQCWKVAYVIDDKGVVVLGTAEKAIAKTEYETISEMSMFSLDEEVEFDNDTVICTGKLFEAGDYPDKQFSLNEDELNTAVANFQPVPNDLQHIPTILDGKLGKLESVYVKGKELFGKVRIPKWLHDLHPQGIKTSLTWTRGNKQICGNALVIKGRVPDAQIVAAFTAAYDNANSNQNDGGNKLTWFDKLKAAFTDGKLPEDLKDFNPDKVTLADDTTPAPVPDPTPAVVAVVDTPAKAQFSDAQIEGIVKNQIKTEAEKFCASAIKDCKIYPAEVATFTAMYTQAVQDDNSGKVCFSESGAVIEGDRVKNLRTLIDARPKHNLTTEQLEGDLSQFSVIPNTTSGEKPPTTERKQEIIDLGTNKPKVKH